LGYYMKKKELNDWFYIYTENSSENVRYLHQIAADGCTSFTSLTLKSCVSKQTHLQNQSNEK
jgi:hypothetical protein